MSISLRRGRERTSNLSADYRTKYNPESPMAVRINMDSRVGHAGVSDRIESG